jgi:hypothetical protein
MLSEQLRGVTQGLASRQFVKRFTLSSQTLKGSACSCRPSERRCRFLPDTSSAAPCNRYQPCRSDPRRSRCCSAPGCRPVPGSRPNESRCWKESDRTELKSASRVRLRGPRCPSDGSDRNRTEFPKSSASLRRLDVELQGLRCISVINVEPEIVGEVGDIAAPT